MLTNSRNLFLAFLIPGAMLISSFFVNDVLGINETSQTLYFILLFNTPIMAIAFLMKESHKLNGVSKKTLIIVSEIIAILGAVLIIRLFAPICANVCPENIAFLRNIYFSEIFLYLSVALMIPVKHFESLLD